MADLPRLYFDEDAAREVPEESNPQDERHAFEIDRDRVLHSAAFRRLGGKTQLFAPGQSDFFRTRLTHSLEVSQIAKGLALRLGANPEICETATLAHDIGHPPFGHRGERVLGRLMARHGGFEANAQNFRVLCRLEAKSTLYEGLNLTRASLDAIAKYKRLHSAGQRKYSFYDEDARLLEWLGHAPETSIEAQIMDYADDIAYAVHDLEDGVKAGLVTDARLRRFEDRVRSDLERSGLSEGSIGSALFESTRLINLMSAGDSERERKASRKTVTSELIGRAIASAKLVGGAVKSHQFRYSATLDRGNEAFLIRCLKAVAYVLVISDPRVQTHEARAQHVLTRLYRFFCTRDGLAALPEDFQELLDDDPSPADRARIVCDYISGMTDDYATRLYGRIFSDDRFALLDY